MGYKVLGQIDRKRYTDMSSEGLEGPFMFESGKVLYYDTQEGKYYDQWIGKFWYLLVIGVIMIVVGFCMSR